MSSRLPRSLPLILVLSLGAVACSPAAPPPRAKVPAPRPRRPTAADVIKIKLAIADDFEPSYRWVGDIDTNTLVGLKRLSRRLSVPRGLSRTELEQNFRHALWETYRVLKPYACQMYGFREGDDPRGLPTVGRVQFGPHGEWSTQHKGAAPSSYDIKWFLDEATYFGDDQSTVASEDQQRIRELDRLALLPRDATFAINADTSLFHVAGDGPTVPRLWVEIGQLRRGTRFRITDTAREFGTQLWLEVDLVDLGRRGWLDGTSLCLTPPTRTDRLEDVPPSGRSYTTIRLRGGRTLQAAAVEERGSELWVRLKNGIEVTYPRETVEVVTDEP